MSNIKIKALSLKAATVLDLPLYFNAPISSDSDLLILKLNLEFAQYILRRGNTGVIEGTLTAKKPYTDAVLDSVADLYRAENWHVSWEVELHTSDVVIYKFVLSTV